jgi:hypothetical protein
VPSPAVKQVPSGRRIVNVPWRMQLARRLCRIVIMVGPQTL